MRPRATPPPQPRPWRPVVADPEDVASLRRALMRHVQVSEDCWTWKDPAPTQPRVRVAGRQVAATHVSWRCAYGVWPAVHTGRQIVVAQCGTRWCVRPRHLGLLSLSEARRLRSDRLGLAVVRECRRCGRPRRIKRWSADHGLGLYCSRKCYFAAASSGVSESVNGHRPSTSVIAT